jgi:hypothetical protein
MILIPIPTAILIIIFVIVVVGAAGALIFFGLINRKGYLGNALKPPKTSKE